MAELRLTVLARQDLDELEQFSFARFGAVQTQRYLDGMRQAFERLREHPGIGIARDDLRTGSRSYRYASHQIYYRRLTGGILIQRILHTARYIRRSMVDGD